ncbi:hypothetical protein KY325_05080 [Candidatus Woesearchaeota archaeon]|nr:hypothetical protein [Candidatus Woesearchaeota archaeon]MBW3018507.1 hypothetical protein [Candidatus Woesearchaeota archaeon]
MGMGGSTGPDTMSDKEYKAGLVGIKPREIYIPVRSVRVSPADALVLEPVTWVSERSGFNLISLNEGTITKQFDTLKTLVEIVHDPLGPNFGERGNPAIVKPIGFRREPLPYTSYLTELGMCLLNPLTVVEYEKFITQMHAIMRDKGGYRVRE